MGKPLSRLAFLNHRQAREGTQRFSGEDRPSTELVCLEAMSSTPVHQDEDLLERLFEDPRANLVAREIAARTVAALADPAVLDPLITLLVDTLISKPLADIATNKTPGDYSCRPVATKSFHNLADYDVFEDLFDIPTGGMIQTSDGPQIEFFLDLAATHCRAIILDVLKRETRSSLNHAADKLRSYLQLVDQHGALDEFAETIFRDLAVGELYDEFSLIHELECQSIETLLLAKRPDQAPRVAKDRAAAARAAPGTRRLRLRINQIVTELFKSLADKPAGFVLSEVELLASILRSVRSIEDIQETDEVSWISLLRLLVKDERLLALLSKRNRQHFERNATHWLHQAGQGTQCIEHPLVALYDRLSQLMEIEFQSFFVRIRQRETISTFNAENWPFFFAYALGPGDPELEDHFEIVVTRIETKTRAAGTSVHETSAGILIDEDGEQYLTAEEFSRGHGAGLAPLADGAILHVEDAKKLTFLNGEETLAIEM